MYSSWLQPAQQTEHKVLLDNGIATGRAEWVMEFSDFTFYIDSNVYINYSAQS